MPAEGRGTLKRRQFLRTSLATSVVGVAGCIYGDSGTEDAPPKTLESTATARQNPKTIFVDASASDGGGGTADEPLNSVQEAVEMATPGQTISVQPGTYKEKITTVRSGSPEKPITITGPTEAVLRGSRDDYGIVRIHHSHIHIRGFTIEGLLQPDPENLRSYVDGQLIQTRPPKTTDEYLSDIVIAPDRIGYSRKSLIGLERTKNAEIGPLRVTGLAGADYVVGSNRDHNGELLYIGTAPNNLGEDWHPWDEFDKTHDVRIHHIDNSAGHVHAEAIDLKPGTHDIVVEYVTDRGGGQVSDDATPNALSHNGHHNVVRWCDLGEAPILVEFDADYPEWTYANSLYGNRIHDYSETAIKFDDSEVVSPRDQDVLCGNEIGGADQHPAQAACQSDVPNGDGIGHKGGDSPW